MANYTGSILVETGPFSWGIQTYRVDGASELKPGYVCTPTGHTYPDIGRPDGDDDMTLGICIENPDDDLDTYFSDNDEIRVARVGSACVVWVYIDDDEGAQVAGTPVYSTGADDDGFVEVRPAVTAPAGDTYSTATMQTALDILKQMQIRYVGRLYEDVADQGSTDTPVKVILI